MTEEEKNQQELSPQLKQERYERECRILAGMLFHPKKYYGMVRQIGLQASDFVDPDTRCAFNALLAVGDEEKDAIKRMDLVEAESKKLRNLCTHLAGYQEEPATIEDMAFIRRVHVLTDFRRDINKVLDDPNMEFAVKAESLKIEMDKLYDQHLNIAAAVDGDQAKLSGAYSLPEHLTHVPGIIDDLIEVTMARSHQPNRTIALAGAIAILGHLMGRRYKAEDGTRPNLYLIVLASSGVGKNEPRIVNIELLDKLGMLDTIISKTASAQGLEDAILEHPCLLLQQDEVDTLFNQLNVKNNTPAEEMHHVLLTLFGSNKSVYGRRVKAKGQNKGKETENDKVHSPSFSFFGQGIPRFFYQSISERTAANGLLPRCLVLEASQSDEENLMPAELDIPPKVMTAIALMFEEAPTTLPTVRPTPVTIQFRPGVEALHAELYKKAKRRSKECAEEENEAAAAIWNRVLEITMKLAMIYAVSENPKMPTISEAGFKWANELVECSLNRTLDNLARYVGGSEFEDIIMTALKIVRNAKSAGITSSMLMKKTKKINAKNIGIVERTLVERNEIAITPVGKNGNGKLYRAVQQQEGK